jgi:hypothetical protein
MKYFHSGQWLRWRAAHSDNNHQTDYLQQALKSATLRLYFMQLANSRTCLWNHSLPS